MTDLGVTFGLRMAQTAKGLKMLGRTIFLLLTLAFVGVAGAETPTGWFTDQQAQKGHQLFNNYCAECHRPDLTGAAGPALKGPDFLSRWGGKPITDLYGFEHSKMPAVNPGSLANDQYWAITAYILSKNGFTAGSSELNDQTASGRILKTP